MRSRPALRPIAPTGRWRCPWQGSPCYVGTLEWAGRNDSPPAAHARTGNGSTPMPGEGVEVRAGRSLDTLPWPRGFGPAYLRLLHDQAIKIASKLHWPARWSSPLRRLRGCV
jgi:hypothetical protein